MQFGQQRFELRNFFSFVSNRREKKSFLPHSFCTVSSQQQPETITITNSKEYRIGRQSHRDAQQRQYPGDHFTFSLKESKQPQKSRTIDMVKLWKAYIQTLSVGNNTDHRTFAKQHARSTVAFLIHAKRSFRCQTNWAGNHHKPFIDDSQRPPDSLMWAKCFVLCLCRASSCRQQTIELLNPPIAIER